MSPVRFVGAPVRRAWPRALPPRPAGFQEVGAGGGVAFSLIVLVTGVLVLRPADIVTGLAGVPIYEVSILACAVAATPALLRFLTRDGIFGRPIDACVFGLLAAIGLSHVAHGDLGSALSDVFEFAKICVYYLLVVVTVDTPRRLRLFLGWLLGFIVAHAGLALLNYHGVIDLPAIPIVYDWLGDPTAGDLNRTPRLCGAGVFANPNDLSRLLVVGIVLALQRIANRGSMLLRPAWAAILALLGYGLILTQSRGGFIDLLVAVVALLVYACGARRALLISAAVLPVLFLAFAGRQTDLTVAEGTGQQRIRLWSDGFVAFAESPVFGIGSGGYTEITGGLAAHNSFFHAYVELGVVGGTLFLGAVYLALTYPQSCARLKPPADPELRRAQPYLLAIVAGYAAGMLSSSRVYSVPTYLLLALTAVEARLVAPPDCGAPPPRFDGRMVRQIILLSAAFLTATYVYVRLAFSR